MTPVEQITSLYIGYFGRAPDPEGLNYWVGRLADGYTLAEAAESFSVQAESTAKYPYLANPNIASPQAFITQVYMNLFNRVPDAEGLAYWTAELQNGADVGDFILNVISGAVTDPDATIVANKVEVGVDFALEAANVAGFIYDDAAAAAAVEVIDGVDATDASVEAAKAETDDFFDDADFGNNFTLTADNAILTSSASADVAGEGFLSGENDIINGLSFTGAVIQDSSTTDNDVLNIIGTSVASDPALVENIETVNLRSINDAASLNLGVFSGLNTVNVSGANDAAITGFDQDAQTIGLSGDTDVTLTGGVNGADDEFNVNVDGATGSLEIDAASGGAAAAVNVNATGAASAFALNVGGVTLTSVDELTVTGDADVEITAVVGGVAVDATEAEGEVSLVTAEIASVDASDFEGVDRLVFTAATLGAADLEAGTVVEFQAATGGATFTVDGAAAAGANDDELTIELNAAVTTDFGAVTANSIETVNIVSSTSDEDAAVNEVNTISLSADAAEEVVITGTTDLDITFTTDVDVVSAGELEGDLTVTLNGAGAVLAETGSGSDTITVSGFADVITTNEGSDNIVFADGSSTAADTVEITDFTAGDLTDVAEVDTLNFSAGATYEAILVANQNAIDADTSLADAAAQAAIQLTAVGETTAFEYDGSTYVLFDSAGNGTYDAAADVLVELTGVAVADLTQDNFI